MSRTLISLGANLGDVLESMRAAKRILIDRFGQTNVRFSRYYRTPPVGGPVGQGDFLNAVVDIETDLSIWDVWESIKGVETSLGRQRQRRWEARRIDIDLLLYDSQRLWTPHLKVPHPRMCMRTFVLEPAQEIVPDWVEPVTGLSISALNKHLLESRQQPIMIICESERHLETLRKEFERNAEANPLKIKWSINAPSSSHEVSFEHPTQGLDLGCKLTIAVVTSPDPMTILWEDYCIAWVNWLNLNNAIKPTPNENTIFIGPRYLLPSDDIQWTIHEIIAADLAMRCKVDAMD